MKQNELTKLRVSIARIAQTIGIDNALGVRGLDYAALVVLAEDTNRGWNDLAALVHDEVVHLKGVSDLNEHEVQEARDEAQAKAIAGYVLHNAQRESVLPFLWEALHGDHPMREVDADALRAVMRALPTYAEVLAAPDAVPVPDDMPSRITAVALYSLCVQKDDLPALWQHISKFDVELRIIFLRRALKMNPDIAGAVMYNSLFKTDKEMLNKLKGV